MDLDRCLNVRQVAQRLGVHENTVRNWEQRGLLKAVRLPGSGFRRFDPSQIERLQAEMLTNLAPAIEGRVIRPTGLPRIVHGDDE